MGSSPSIPQEKHIVIVGGGYAGVNLAVRLKKKGVNFTIVSARDAMHHNVASVRSLIEPGFAAKTLIPLSEAFGDQFKNAKVQIVKPEAKKLILDGGDEMAYDTLVLATGSHGPFPYKLKESNAESILPIYENWRQQLEKSQRIVVVGGGPTGVEQAAEIAAKFPEKEVTIIHSGQKLILDDEILTRKFHNRLRQILDEMKIKVILGEKVEDVDSISGCDVEGPITVKTDQGQEIECDLVLKCTGLTINCAAYRDSLGEAVTETGELKVNEFLQVEGHSDVYAVGDCAKLPELKLAYNANIQTDWLAGALPYLLNGEKTKPYKAGSAPVVMGIALGPNHGLAQTKGGFMPPEFVMRALKSKDLMVNKFWKNVGLKVPS